MATNRNDRVTNIPKGARKDEVRAGKRRARKVAKAACLAY